MSEKLKMPPINKKISESVAQKKIFKEKKLSVEELLNKGFIYK